MQTKFLLQVVFGSIIALGQSAKLDAQGGELRLIKTSENEPAKWLNDDQVLDLIKQHKGFFDVTDQDDNILENDAVVSAVPIPTTLKYKTQTVKAQGLLDMPRAKLYLQGLSNFHTRYYTTQTGADAAIYIKNYVANIAKKYSGTIQVEEFKHSWAQPSIIARIVGTKYPQQLVVLGAHLDSINQNNPVNGRSPGADDDGSGTTTLVETFQAIIESGFKPQRTLEFQFYAGEEKGLLGSQAIVKQYKQQQKEVVAMMQIDMDGYRPSNVNTIKIITDYTNPELSSFIKLLIGNYSKYAAKDGTCGYACSDHASYHQAGYRAAFPHEQVLARGIHTDKDVIGDVDFDYLLQFAKVAVGYAIELGEPSV